MPKYYVTGTFTIEAPSSEAAENIVQNAVEATIGHIETDSVDADDDDNGSNLVFDDGGDEYADPDLENDLT